MLLKQMEQIFAYRVRNVKFATFNSKKKNGILLIFFLIDVYKTILYSGRKLNDKKKNSSSGASGVSDLLKRAKDK